MSDINTTSPMTLDRNTYNTSSTTDGNAAHEGRQSENQNATTWPQLAEGLYSFLTGRGAVIEYTFENMEVWVPRDATDSQPSAKWKVNGTLRVRTSEPGLGGSAKG